MKYKIHLLVSHLSDDVVAHWVLRRGRQQGGLWQGLGLGLLSWARQQAAAGLGGYRWDTHNRTNSRHAL